MCSESELGGETWQERGREMLDKSEEKETRESVFCVCAKNKRQNEFQSFPFPLDSHHPRRRTSCSNERKDCGGLGIAVEACQRTPTTEQHLTHLNTHSTDAFFTTLPPLLAFNYRNKPIITCRSTMRRVC